MSKYARIVASTAIEIFTPPAGSTLAECFHPDVAAQFKPVPADVEVGWNVDDTGWHAPPPPAPSMEPPAP